MKWLIFLKLFVTMEDINYKCLRVDIIFNENLDITSLYLNKTNHERKY